MTKTVATVYRELTVHQTQLQAVSANDFTSFHVLGLVPPTDKGLGVGEMKQFA